MSWYIFYNIKGLWLCAGIILYAKISLKGQTITSRRIVEFLFFYLFLFERERFLSRSYICYAGSNGTHSY